jgi:hypothetical protein
MDHLTAAPADDNTSGLRPEVPSHPTAERAENIALPVSFSSPDPMQAIRARNQGMDRALFSTSRDDRAAIAAAILRGMDLVEPRRVEDALAKASFPWPPSANPKSLGAIVSHLSRVGLIKEVGLTKGRSGRSHAGRVSLWLKVTP